MNDLSTEIRIGADASGVEAGVGRAKRSLKDLGDSARSAGQTVAAAGKQAGESLATVGDGGEAAAKKIQRDTRSMQSSLQRYLATLEAGSKDSRKYWESMADFKGVDKAALRPLLDQLDAYKAKANAAADASSAFKLSVGGFGVAATALTAVSATAGVAAKAMFDASVSAERLRTMLDFSTGGNSAREIEYLRGVTARLGLEFTSTAKAYGQFQAAAKGTALEGDKARAVFESVAKASAVMGLSADDTSGVLLALQQMLSKGTVSAEELRGQLGERLPGSFQVAARAMGVTTAELGKMLEQGQIVADDFLPKFGKALEQNLGGAAEKAANRLDASVNRLNTAWDRLKQNGGDAGTSSFMAGQYEILADGFNGVSEAMERARSSGSGFIGQMSAGAVAVAKFANPLQAFSYTAIESGNALKQAEEEFAALQARGDQMGGNIYYKAEMARLAALIKELKTAQAEKDKLTKGDDSKINPGIVASGQGRERYYQQREKDEEAANAFRLKQAGVPASYLKDMTELIRLNQAGVIVGKEYTDALKAQQDLLLKKTTTVRGSAAAANAEQNAYESLIASIRAKIEADNLEIAGGAALTESQRIRIKLDQDLAAGRVKLTAQNERAVRLALEELAASEASALAAKTLAKANLDAAASREKYLVSLSTGLDKIKADTAAQLEATARLGLSKEAIAELDAAKLEMLATDLELQAIKAMDRNLDEQTYNALKQQAEAYRELAAAKKAGAAKEMELDLVKANQEAAKKAADEWQRAADDINRSLTDALMRGFESGKDFAENLRDTVSNMFSTLVLRPIISAVMSPVAGAINGMLYGNAAAAAGGGANALGMLGSGANLINGLQGTQGMLGTVGGWLGMNTVAANTALASSIGIDAASAAAAANAAGAAGGGLLSGVGAALPWIGGIAALASILGGLDDSGTYHTGGAAQYSAATGLRTSLGFRDNEEGLPSYNPNDNIDNQFGTGFGYVERSDQTIDVVSNLARGLGMALDGVAVAFGEKAGYAVATAFADDASEDGAWGALRISKDGQELLNWENNRQSRWAPKEFGDGEGGYKEYLAAVAKDTRQVLLDMDLPSWADKMLESIGDSASMEQLTGVLTQIGVVQSAFVSLGKSMEMFSGLTDEMQSGLLAAAGSIDALTAGAGAFYQGFYSEQERVDSAVAQLNATLAGLDLSIDPTLGDDAKAQFRAAVEAAFAAGDAELAAGLLAISGNFASAADYFEQLSQSAAQAAAQAAEQAAQMAERLAAEQASIAGDLRRQIMELTGDTTAIRQLEIAGMNAANVALYDRVQALQAEAEQTAIRADLERQVLELTGDTAAIRQLEIAGMDAVNVALYDRIQALQSEAQASEQAAQAAAEQAAIGESLQRQIIQLTGDTAAIRQLEIAGMDAANVALYDRVQALQASQAAEQAAADKAKQVAQERYGIETSMLQLQGNTAALRARELALLDPANRADQLRLYILQDAQEAAKAAADAERDLAAARVQSAQDAYRAAQDATGGAFDALSRSVEAERSLYESTRAAAADAAQEIKSVIDTLAGSIKDLYAGVDSTRRASAAEGASFITRALQAARTTGYLPDSQELSDAITQARDGLGSQNYATQFEADRAQLIMAGQLSELSDIAKPQLTAAERTLRNAEDQLKALDDILKNAQSQVDAVRGINTIVGTIPAALDGLQAALLAEAQAKAQAQATTPPPATAPTTPTTPTGGALSGPYASQITDAIKAAAYTTDDRLVYDTARMLGVTSSELDKLMGWTAGTSLDWAKRNNLPAFAVGTNYVPRDMLATIHEGEAIVPKAFNPWAAGGQGMGGGNTEVVAELRALRQQNERLESRLASIEGSNNTMVSLLDDVTDGGNAMRSEVMA